MGAVRRRAGAACLVATALVTGALLLPSSGASPAQAAPSEPSAGQSAMRALASGTPTAGEVAPHDHGDGTHTHSVAQDSVVRAAQEAVAVGDRAVAADATLPTGFSDAEVISNITEATSAAFAPDGTAFIALKTGQIKSFDYLPASSAFEPNATSTNFADLSVPVNNYWDRGLTGIVADPQFGTAGHNFVYVSYTYNRDPRDNPPVVPKYGDPGQAYDECPDLASETFDGCIVMMRVSRLTAEQTTYGWTMVPGSERELMASGCFQFGSHASGDLIFGPDGKLYASAGDGASFDTNDYGQYRNACRDPADEGGGLRSQDYRTSGDPLGVDGSVFRIDPVNGLVPSQATAEAWLVAYGQRNPWRLTFRPGTTELWSADVGASAWEEINRRPAATTPGAPVNRGWPCYEGTFTGSAVNPGWDALDKPLCESLYAQGTGAVAAPYFSYQTRGGLLTPGEDCTSSTSSVSGVAFSPTSSTWPEAFRGSLFFSDYARSCIWRLGKDASGNPDPTRIIPFVQSAETPVQLKVGPGGDLYYVDYGLDDDGAVVENAAGVHRITYAGGGNAAPTARITTTGPPSGVTPLRVEFSGATSSDPDGDRLSYAWDLDGDGAYDDSSATAPSFTYTRAGTYDVGLRVDDGQGHTASTSLTVRAGTPPVLSSVLPAADYSWVVGQRIPFSATATDGRGRALPASAFQWDLAIRHCPSGVCHTHALTGYTGVSSGAFQAPDHEYPSHLLLTVTVTDGDGLSTAQTVRLDPRTADLTFASSPPGAGVTVNSGSRIAPWLETFLQGSQLTATAAPTTLSGGETWAFDAWSNGGARSQELKAPTGPTSYLATYTRPTLTLTAAPAQGPAPTSVTYTAAATNPAGSTGLAYAWDTDGDGQYDDGTGTTQTRDWVVGSPAVRVRVTDSRGATDTESSALQQLTLTTKVKGLTLKVDGQSVKAEAVRLLPVGTVVRLVAPKSQKKKGIRYFFKKWADTKQRKRTVTVGVTPLVLKAVYRRQR